MKGKILVALQFLLLAALALFPGAKESPKHFVSLAFVLLVLGVTLLLKSFRDLGQALTPLPESKEGAQLVTTGIYEYLRHPIYSSIILIASGVVFWKWSSGSLLIALALLILLIYKSRYEDKLLRAKFGSALQYQKRTGAFFPTIKRGNRK